MRMKKSVMQGICVLLIMCLLSSGLVYATDTKETEPDNVIIEQNSQGETEQFHIWGTFADAKLAYGLSLTYGVLSYNAAGGYFLCYCLKTDGTMFYFGCYAL